MKRIVIMAGHGLNERGWARHVSKYGQVVLIQEGFTDHVECWEAEQRTFFGPELNVAATRYFDNLTFGGLTMWRALRECLKHSRGEKIDLIIGVGYSMALVALFLRCVGKTKRFACSVVDHLPLKGSIVLRIHRLIAGWLTYLTARFADEVWVISPRIPAGRFNPRNYVIPFPIDDHGVAAGNRAEIAYIGVPSYDHGLDLLFEACRKNAFRLNIIGDSPYLESIKELAPPQTIFHGWLNDKERVNAIFARCFCGYAVYRATGPQSYSYYGFPSKALSCFASNTPILTTKTSSFTQQVESLGIGRVVEPTLEEVEGALLDLKQHYAAYYEAINHFRANWNAEVERFHRERLATLLAAPPSAMP